MNLIGILLVVVLVMLLLGAFPVGSGPYLGTGYYGGGGLGLVLIILLILLLIR